jgi:excisionase family DNA binding protein
MQQLLTVEDVAARLQVKPATVYDWVYKRRISCIKLPQGLRFKEEYLENWLNKKIIKAKS